MSRGRGIATLGLLSITLSFTMPVCLAQTTLASANQSKEAGANVQDIPKPILRTGISLNKTIVSPNSAQLAKNIGLIPVIEQIQLLRSRINSGDGESPLENLKTRQDLNDTLQKAIMIIQKTVLEVDFAASECEAESQLYNEILTTFTNDRDKAIARTNALSFISNGILWAVCESLAIPTYKNANFAIPSGIVGIPAGVVPSIASMYTLKQINGKKKTSEVEPNMLAKLFNYPSSADIEYPNSVWQFLHEVPASEPGGKTRLNQMIDRWIADANMPGFTDRHSKKQLDVLTASVAQRKGLSINTLTARIVMLEQLQCEIMKMKRMLLELSMAIEGEKQLTASEPSLERKLPRIGMQ